MKWNTISVIVNLIVQVLRISVLARFLNIDDFGMIAIALMVVSFTEIFADLGFTVPLIHKQKISTAEYSSVFWVNNILALIIFGIILISSPFIARLYDTPELTPVIRVLSVVVLLNALGKIFQTMKQKELEYRFISIVSISSNLIGFSMMVVLAIYGYGVWSLVYGTIIMTALRQGVYFFVGIRGSRIRFYCSIPKIKDFIRIGSYQLGAQILDFTASKIDIIILGKTIGLNDLGTYNLAKELIVKCYALSNSLTRGVMSAAFAKIQHNIKALSETFLKFCKINSWVFVPIFAVIFIFSDDVSLIMYGEKWTTIYEVLAILSIYGAFSAIVAPLGSVLISLGRTDLSLVWTIVQTVTSAGSILICSKYGFICVVYSQVFIAMSLFILSWWIIIRKLLSIGFMKYIIDLATPIAVCGILVSVLAIIRSRLNMSFTVDSLICIVFLISYLFILIKKFPQIYFNIKNLIHRNNK